MSISDQAKWKDRLAFSAGLMSIVAVAVPEVHAPGATEWEQVSGFPCAYFVSALLFVGFTSWFLCTDG